MTTSCDPSAYLNLDSVDPPPAESVVDFIDRVNGDIGASVARLMQVTAMEALSIDPLVGLQIAKRFKGVADLVAMSHEMAHELATLFAADKTVDDFGESTPEESEQFESQYGHLLK